MVDLLVLQEQDRLLGLEHTLDHCSDFGDHRHQEGVVALVHESLEVFELVVKFLLNIVLHLMRNQATGNLITDLRNNCEVVRGEVLVAFLVGNFKAANRMAAKLNRYKQDVPDDLVQSLIHRNVLSQLLLN